MKKLASIVLSLILIISSFGFQAYADDADYIETHGGDLEQQRKNAQILAQKADRNGISTYGWGYGCTGDFPEYRQETTYYCGPACLQMVIEYITGTKYSQSFLAEEAGTTSADGTYVYRMTNALNDLQNEFSYAYRAFSTSNSTEASLQSAVTSTISSNYPVIFHARTGSLAKYNGTNLGHYLVGVAISNNGGVKITYVDPYYANYGNGSVFGLNVDTLTAFYESLTKWGQRYLIY